eukprot:2909035-Rhodomonas_salina.1
MCARARVCVRGSVCPDLHVAHLDGEEADGVVLQPKPRQRAREPRDRLRNHLRETRAEICMSCETARGGCEMWKERAGVDEGWDEATRSEGRSHRQLVVVELEDLGRAHCVQSAESGSRMLFRAHSHQSRPQQSEVQRVSWGDTTRRYVSTSRRALGRSVVGRWGLGGS